MPSNWSVFDEFESPPAILSWDATDEWIEQIEADTGGTRRILAGLRAQSDSLLFDLGGDPSAEDWMFFRPLRRDREEDWSDWLAQLIERSSTGQFARYLLHDSHGQTFDHCRDATVQREVSHESKRADLIVEWSDRTYTHIEVKVGDPNLAKTYETALLVERHLGYILTRRADVILLLPSQAGAWDAACRQVPNMREQVSVITWFDVARSLRRALVPSVGESLTWRVWARSLCGAIEQQWLGMRSGADPVAWASALSLHELESAIQLLSATESLR